ncbi:uncharacterized protein Eint_041435 [Encephalitozoon intestinalis ATCC 50506]|uniref:Uncharacterized protein n=1 Tax=Encephalitozoon intestinalis (strain ATCC 50506) TaxID=876142 RepID=W8P8X9_ENCIT|nr:uncharacterized protein Eint_041435 [Encephalitozoon intestinalis ATCC 50506]AHL30093.1 hypothetical protein Eint_041435 [Encephalitozoon intestinalis ATCC 50506]UTX45125.1 hypothetical protein GPK93_04g06650 [Encephalitozoon intestinalis]
MKYNELPGFDEHPESIYKLVESMGVSNIISKNELTEAILESKEFKDFSSLSNQKNTEFSEESNNV